MSDGLFPNFHFPLPQGGLPGGSPWIHKVSTDYERQTASAFVDKPAKLTERQACFYKGLIDIAVKRGTASIPVDFTASDGTRMYLDRGCIKIAELAQFIKPLENNDSEGRVGHVCLNWRVSV